MINIWPLIVCSSSHSGTWWMMVKSTDRCLTWLRRCWSTTPASASRWTLPSHIHSLTNWLLPSAAAVIALTAWADDANFDAALARLFTGFYLIWALSSQALIFLIWHPINLVSSACILSTAFFRALTWSVSVPWWYFVSNSHCWNSSEAFGLFYHLSFLDWSAGLSSHEDCVTISVGLPSKPFHQLPVALQLPNHRITIQS